MNLVVSVETKYCPDCKTVLPIKKFTGRWRYRSEGKVQVFDPRCSKCEYLRKKVKSMTMPDKPVVKTGEHGKKRKLKHTGPKRGSPEHLFMCLVKPCAY